MLDNCKWTPAQQAAFEQIERIVREHFDAGVFHLMAEINDGQDESRGSYHGGKNNAIGLHSRGLHDLLHKPPDAYRE